MDEKLGLLGYTSFISYTYDIAGLDLSSHLVSSSKNCSYRYFHVGAAALRDPIHPFDICSIVEA